MDVTYWDKQYSQKGRIYRDEFPTNFAQYCLTNWVNYFISDRENENSNVILLDIGAGNGRDSKLFYDSGVKVLAIDQSGNAVNCIRDIKGIESVCADITEYVPTKRYDIIYSRQSLDYITDNQVYDMLSKFSNNFLSDDGIVCLELKSDKDMNNLGRNVSKISDHEFIKSKHYIRFSNYEKIVKDVRDLGFEILHKHESAVGEFYENQAVIRLIIGR